jgi:hypothetical protein
MKRQVTQDASSASSSRRSIKRYRKSKPRRSLGIFTSGISRCTRSTFIEFNIASQTQTSFGLAFNSTGVLSTTNNNTLAIQAWAGGNDIGNLYDAYRLVCAKVRYDFNQDSGTVGQLGQSMPYLYAAIDYDDINTAAGTVVEILQKPGVKQCVMGRGTAKGADMYMTVTPKVAVAAYASSIANGYLEPRAKQWVSTSTGLTGQFVDPPHYGIKHYFDTSTNTTGAGVSLGRLRMFVTCYFEMKGST